MTTYTQPLTSSPRWTEHWSQCLPDVTGPANATKAIIFVFDIFGYFPQTIQGADILSTSHDHEKYLVFMPDFFEGKPADIAWYPPTDETKQKLLGEWFQTQGSPFEGAKKIDPILKSIEKEYSGIKSWGVIGVCEIWLQYVIGSILTNFDSLAGEASWSH